MIEYHSACGYDVLLHIVVLVSLAVPLYIIGRVQCRSCQLRYLYGNCKVLDNYHLHVSTSRNNDILVTPIVQL